MRKYFVLGVVATTACAVFAAMAFASNNSSTITNTFTPSTIPAGKYKGGKLQAHLTTIEQGGGTPTAPTKLPSPTKHVKVYLDHAFKVTTTGLPTCTQATLTGTTTAQAEAACGPGSGNNAEVTLTNAGVSNPGSSTVCISNGVEGNPCGAVLSGVITAYNGPATGSGQPQIFLHTYVAAANSTTIIRGILKSTSLNGFKKFLDTTVPPVAGGAGALTDFNVTLNRKYNNGGPNLYFLKATCDDNVWDFQADYTYTDNSTETATNSQACTAS